MNTGNPAQVQRTRDPALVDRRRTLLAGIAEEDLPRRRMTMSGIEGALDARILSTDLNGDTTRLVRIPPGWGTGLVGSFSADVEVFVIRGDLIIGPETMGPCDFVAIRQARPISGLRSRAGAVALFMSSAPVRYDTHTGGRSAELAVARGTQAPWEPDADRAGRYVRRLGHGLRGEVWLGAADRWQGVSWHTHVASEEMFVLDEKLAMAELIDGETVVYRYGPGGYCFRPAGRPHGGPGSGCEGPAVTFHRSLGQHAKQTWGG
jgi:hypothetical protein